MAQSWKFNPDNTIEDKDGNKIDFKSLVKNENGVVKDIQGNTVEVEVANSQKLGGVEAKVYKNTLCINTSVIDSDTDVVIGGRYLTVTKDNTVTCTLPDSAEIGDSIMIIDIDGTFGDKAVTLTKSNSDHTINGGDDDVDLNVSGKMYTVIFRDNNWSIFY